ncbi:hypothetical protein D3C73_814060 [compost metagenome]
MDTSVTSLRRPVINADCESTRLPSSLTVVVRPDTAEAVALIVPCSCAALGVQLVATEPCWNITLSISIQTLCAAGAVNRPT